jgi:hypothetical protein
MKALGQQTVIQFRRRTAQKKPLIKVAKIMGAHLVTVKVCAAAEAAWLAPIHISTQHNAAAAVKIYVSIVANRIQRGWNMFLAVYGQWRCGRSAFTTAALA